MKARPSFSASGSSGRTSSATTPPACTLTASGTNSPCNASFTLFATARPALSCASAVEAPRCGVATTLSKANSGEEVHGSLAYTSTPAPPTRPSASASARACSSTRPPRAALTIRTPGLTMESSFSPISPTVSGVFGRWMEMKSLSRSSSSRPTRRTPSCAARAGWMYGSYAISRVPNAAMRCANSTPMRPRPTTPTVLPWISTPVYFDRFHSPALRAALALAVFRATASSRATACSAAETMLEVGALTTMTPRAVAAGTSTLSRPDACPGHDLQTRRGGDRLGVDLGGAADDDGVGLGERGEQGRAVGAVDVPDVEVVGEHLDGGGGEFFGDQYDRSHWSS